MDTPKALSSIETAFGISYMKQVHGADIKFIDKPGEYACDGIFTACDNMALVVKTADCMPILFHSEKEGLSGALHMGWRSAKDGILDNIAFDLSSFTVVAGVGMRRCCYRVGEEFLGHVRLKPFVNKKGDSYYFDPAGFLRHSLIRKGMKEENFIDHNTCSHCSEGGFFSHRKTATKNRTLSFVIKTDVGSRCQLPGSRKNI